MFKELGDKPENQNENLDYLQHDAANMVSDTDALGKLKAGLKNAPYAMHAVLLIWMFAMGACMCFRKRKTVPQKQKLNLKNRCHPKKKHHLLQRIRWCLLRLIRVKMLTCSKL